MYIIDVAALAGDNKGSIPFRRSFGQSKLDCKENKIMTKNKFTRTKKHGQYIMFQGKGLYSWIKRDNMWRKTSRGYKSRITKKFSSKDLI